MTDHPCLSQCFLCRRAFPFGPGRYAGKPIRAWDIMVCDTCLNGNWDGIVPSTYPHLIEYLKSRGIAVVLNAKGWLDWPR